MEYRPKALEALQRFEYVLNERVGICRKSWAILAGRFDVLDRRFFNECVEV